MEQKNNEKNKLEIYNSIVKATSGVKTYKFNKNLESKLIQMEIEFVRSARFSRLEEIKNYVSLRKMNIKNSLLDYITYKQLYWYDHVQRMNEERLPRKILVWFLLEEEEEKEGLEIRGCRK